MDDSKHLVVLTICYIAVFLLTFTGDHGLITAGNDMANILPGALWTQDHSLYSSDVFFTRFIAFYPKPFLWLFGTTLSLIGDLKTATYLLSSVFFLVFLFGVYALISDRFNDKRVGLLAALLSIAVRPALGVKYGINLSIAIPRYALLALSPWLILWFYRKHEEANHLLSVFLVIGLLANVHPISAGLLCAILLGVLVLEKGLGGLKDCAIGLSAFLVGASPLIISKILTVSTSGIAPRWLILQRAWFILPPYLKNLGNYGLFLLQISPFLLMGGLGYLKAKKHQRGFALLGISVFVVSALTALEYLWPKAVTFEFLRASVWLYLPLMGYTSLMLVALWKRDRFRRVVALLLFLVLAIPAIAIQPAQQGAITLYGALTGHEPYVFDYRDADEFHRGVQDLGEWLQANTPKDVLLMVPPRGVSHLRYYGRRSLVVTHKDANIHSEEGALLWHDRYTDVSSVYAGNETSAYVDAAQRYGADYILIDKKKNAVDLPVLYENERFALLSPTDTSRSDPSI